jgi:vacuolar-type H+-ATPase subunit E/Vma4
MTLDRLIAEIQSSGARDLAEARSQFEAERARIVADRDRRVGALKAEIARAAETTAKRERAQRIAGARMQARKLEYEARERALSGSLDSVRETLRAFTKGPEYGEVLERMYAFAADELGKDVRISGRADDAAALKALAGKSYVPDPQPILGGLIAESADGKRRLTLTLEELLRLREDRVRELLA